MISVGIYLVWMLFLLLMPDFIDGVQTRWFAIPRDTCNAIMFSIVGAFKLVLSLFVLFPCVSLLIVGEIMQDHARGPYCCGCQRTWCELE